MNPEQLAEKNSESGHQKALFAWAAIAQQYGFVTADDMTAYDKHGLAHSLANRVYEPVPALRWLHSIPNGGARDPVTASRMKAEGARAGVPDVFLPVASDCWGSTWHGLYIEMKTSTGKQSTEQIEFALHCARENFQYDLCRNWREAANVIKKYLKHLT